MCRRRYTGLCIDTCIWPHCGNNVIEMCFCFIFFYNNRWDLIPCSAWLCQEFFSYQVYSFCILYGEWGIDVWTGSVFNWFCGGKLPCSRMFVSDGEYVSIVSCNGVALWRWQAIGYIIMELFWWSLHRNLKLLDLVVYNYMWFSLSVMTVSYLALSVAFNWGRVLYSRKRFIVCHGATIWFHD